MQIFFSCPIPFFTVYDSDFLIFFVMFGSDFGYKVLGSGLGVRSFVKANTMSSVRPNPKSKAIRTVIVTKINDCDNAVKRPDRSTETEVRTSSFFVLNTLQNDYSI